MRIPLLSLALALALAFCPPVTADAPVPVPGDEQDLVIWHTTRPFRVRLHLQVDGKPFRSGWDVALQSLFRYLDRDGDGSLNRAELELAPSLVQLLQITQGAGQLDPDAAPDFTAVDANADGKVSLAELSAFYRKGDIYLRAEWLAGFGTPLLSDALFKALDTDKDDKLSKDELTAAATSLARLDGDGNEMISASELRPDVGVGATASVMNAETAEGKSVRVVQAGEPRDGLVRTLFTRHDKDKDRKLSPAEVALDKDAFKALDADEDGFLDSVEVAKWFDQPADVEGVVQLGRMATGERVVIQRPAKTARLHNGTLRMALGDMVVDLFVAPDVGGPREPVKAMRGDFTGLDRNKDGFVDTREAAGAQFTFLPLLRLADADGDNRLSLKEYEAWVEVQQKLGINTTILGIADHGPDLFGLLDADGDGRLSLRELKTAPARLAPFAVDGKLPRAGVPRQLQLSLRHARRPAPTTGFVSPFRRVERTRGPLWFRKMDRNGDGDVSADEFLGTAEEFRRLDKDGDGLLDADEAEQAEKELRPKR